MKKILREKKFKPKPGQVDFTNVRWAPVVNCIAMYRGNILLVRRDPSLHFYPGYWNGVSGFLDDKKSLREKVVEEFREELGIKEREIISVRLGEVFDQNEPRYQKTWIVHPILVRVASDRVVLDWEAQKYAWVTMREAGKLKLLPGCRTVLQKIKPLMRK